ncbi:MAG TPA: outer membrane protein transport protein [Nevskiaceae bacterium]|nr:outer membrane protein transport protein [Nevskiaceae bacterium]
MNFPFRGAARVGAACLLLSPAVATATNGFVMHGIGTASKAMGGVGYALPQDALVSGINPAGLALVEDQVYFGADWILPERGASIEGNRLVTLQSADGRYRGDEQAPFFVPELGYKRSLRPAWSVGVAAYGNGGLNTNYADNPYAAFGSTGNMGVDLAQLFVAPAVAWQLSDRQSIGLALNVVYQRFEAYGLDAFATTAFPGPYSESPDRLTNRGYDDSFGVGFRLGWLAEPLPHFTVGIGWQPKIRMSRFDQYRGLFADQGRFDIPANYGAGIAYRWRDRVAVALDVQHIAYDGVRSLRRPMEPLLDGHLIGSDHGPGFGWRGMTVLKLGAAWQVVPSLRVSAGYSRGRQPVRRDQTFFNIIAPAIVEQHYTVGLRYEIDTRWSVSTYYCRGPTHEVHGRDSIPENQLTDPLPPTSLGGGEADLRLNGKSAGITFAYSLGRAE